MQKSSKYVLEASQDELMQSDYQQLLQIKKAPIALKPLTSKSTGMFKQNLCNDVLSKLTVAPMKESQIDMSVIPETLTTPGLRQHGYLQSEYLNNTIKLPSQIGGTKAS